MRTNILILICVLLGVTYACSDVDLVYNKEGVLLREIIESQSGQNPGNYIPSELPAVIKEYLNANHKNASIVDVGLEKIKWEVEIVENDVKKELNFDVDGKWILTKWDIKIKEIPETLKIGIQKSPYIDWEIDGVEYLQILEGDFYQVEFEKEEEKEVKVLLSGEDGSIVLK